MEKNENKVEVVEIPKEVEQIEQPTITESKNGKEKIMAVINVIKEKALSIWGKMVDMFKADPKKMGIIAGSVVLAAVILVTSVILVFGALTNTYKTPIKVMQKYDNAKRYYSQYDYLQSMSNGVFDSEIKDLASLYKQSEDYKDDLDDAKDYFKDSIEDLKDDYGKNYKIKYKVIDKEKLDKDDIKDFRDSLRESGKDLIEEIEEETEDYDSDDWEDLADDFGFDGNKAKAKSMVKIMKNLGKTLKSVKVSAGYEVTYVKTITGSELDEPIETEDTICVYKINGKWTTESLTNLGYLF